MKKRKTCFIGSPNMAIGRWVISVCGHWYGTRQAASPVTDNPRKVTCGRCQRTHQWRARNEEAL